MTKQDSTFDITVEIDPPYARDVDADQLVQVATQALAREGTTGPLEMGIWITNEDEIQALNRTYRNVDAATDVLSFGQDDTENGPFVHAPGAVRYLGDIAISFPHVIRQAGEYGHSRNRELSYLLAHGVLHLLGYDHEEPADAKEMREHEERVLGDLGITRDDDERDSARP